MAHDVFISYSHHDKAAADAVCAKLEQHQIRCWIAPRDVVPGIEWADCIINAIHGTRVMVLVFSSNANESPQIRKEVERAVNKGVVIVPLRIEDVVPTRSLEYFMSNVHWLDALTPPLDQHLEHLAGTVKMLIERADAGDVNERYSGIRPDSPRHAQRKNTRWLGIIPLARRGLYLTVFAAVLLVVASSLAVWRHLHPPLRTPRLAVIGPTNNSNNPQYDYVSTQVADIVSAYLSQANVLNAVPREDIIQMQQDISVPADPGPCSGNLHPAPLQQVFAASYLVFGNFNLNTDPHVSKIHINLCLLNSNGNVIDNFERDWDEPTIGNFAKLAAEEFREKIGNVGLVPQDLTKVFPQDPDASRLYFQGLADMRVYNAAKARDELLDAAQKEDSSSMIHSALSQAWSMLRQDEKAKQEANLALSHLPDPFPLEYRTEIRASAAEMNKQWDLALPDYEDLSKSNPERLDLGLKFAFVQREAQQSDKELATLTLLSKLGPPLGKDPRISIEKARALIALSNFQGGIDAAESALAAANQKNFPVMQANANLQLCWAYLKVGKVDKASTSCDNAQQTFRSVKDFGSAAVALNGVANWLTETQRYKEARDAYDKVVAVQETAQDPLDLAGALLNRAKVSDLLEDLSPAETDLNRAIVVARSIQDTSDQARALDNLSVISQERGNMEAALKQATEARSLAHGISDKDAEATALSHIALAEAETGHLADALADNKSLLLMRTDPVQIAITSSYMGDIYFRLADFQSARANYQKAQDLFAQHQQPDNVNQILLDLAQIDLEERDFAAAEKKATQVLQAVSGKTDEDDSKADALASLLRALVGQSKLPEAGVRLKDLEQIKTSNGDVGFDVALAKGPVLIAQGKSAEALGILNKASSDALAKGEQFTALQLRLVAVQAMQKSGDNAGAAKTLSEIRASAQRFGFKLISNQANDLGHSLKL